MRVTQKGVKHLLILSLTVGSLFLSSGCVFEKPEIKINLGKTKKEELSAEVSAIEVVENKIHITGTNLQSITQFSIKEGGTQVPAVIESKTATSIIARPASNIVLAVGKVVDFVFANAHASTSTTVNFSLCDSLLGGKGFNCIVQPNDKEVLSFDASTDKWKPRAVNGLSYKGAWDAGSGLPATGALDEGDYFIVSVADSPHYEVGDWIVYNGMSFDRINNSTAIVSVFGRTGSVVPTKGDYDLTELSDVLITSAATGQILRFNGTNWVNASLTETDPSVQAFAKSALPNCATNEVLKSNGSVFSCVTVPSSGGGGTTFTGTANRVVATDGSGALTSSSVTTTQLGYLSNVSSDIQAQITSISSNITSAVLTGLSTVASSAATATDSILVAIGKLQAQLGNKADRSNVSQSITAGTVTATSMSVTNSPLASSDVVNLGYLTSNYVTSPWSTGSGNTYIDGSPSVGIGTNTPASKLEVNGDVKIGNSAVACSGTNEGAQRYNSTSKIMEFCNGTAWTSFAPTVTENPTGTLITFSGAAAPAGYLLADGSAVSRTTYAALFAVIGTSYGVGNGTTTFNLPDLRGRTAIGAGAATGLTDRALASRGGTELVNGKVEGSFEMIDEDAGSFVVGGDNTHYLAIPNDGAGTTYQGYRASGSTLRKLRGLTIAGDGFTGGDGTDANMQPYVAVNYMIKY